MKKPIIITCISVLLILAGLLVLDSIVNESKALPSNQVCSVPLYNYKNHIGRPCYGCEELQFKNGQWVWVLISVSAVDCVPSSMSNCIAYTCAVSESCRVVVSQQDSCDQGPWK